MYKCTQYKNIIFSLLRFCCFLSFLFLLVIFSLLPRQKPWLDSIIFLVYRTHTHTHHIGCRTTKTLQNSTEQFTWKGNFSKNIFSSQSIYTDIKWYMIAHKWVVLIQVNGLVLCALRWVIEMLMAWTKRFRFIYSVSFFYLEFDKELK